METGGPNRQEMDAKRLESSESRIRGFESFARSTNHGKKGGEKTNKELPPKPVEPFLEEKEAGGFLDRVVPGKSKDKARARKEKTGEERTEARLTSHIRTIGAPEKCANVALAKTI